MTAIVAMHEGEIVNVELDEKRTLDIVTSDVFGIYTRRIRRHFKSNGAIE